jgi:type I restriction enzyme S subunit
MEVKPGYKQTEVGVIPDDWDVKPLGELGKFKNGINKGKEDFGHGFPFINLMDVFGIPKVSASTTELGLVNSTVAERKLYEMKAGDVLFVRSSVKPEGVGLTTLIPEDLPETVFSGFLIRFRDTGSLYCGFKEHCFWDERFRSRLVSNSTVSANTNINQDALKRLQIAFPSRLSEQRAIAEALSDVDALLGSLDRLIAKKRDLKQAAMQQLLTGQTRLPGFHGEWAVKRLGDLFEITSSKRVFQSEWKSEGIPFYRARELAVLGETGRVDNELFITKSLYDSFRTAHGVPEVGDMLATGVGTLGKVYVVQDEEEFYFKDGNIIWFKIRGAVSAAFLRQLYLTKVVMKQITDGSAGTTVGTYTISGAKKTEIPFPPVPEQTAIAEVLTDMDAELAALEQRREKTRALKQAMMQELLTGKTRLI